MPTTAECGMTGSVSTGGEVTRWTLTLRQDILDATSMSSGGFFEGIGCLRDASFEFDTLTPAGAIGAQSAVTFTNEKGSWTFDAIFQSLRTSVDVNGVVTFTYSGVSTGAIS
jgi:hypothetical protein